VCVCQGLAEGSGQVGACPGARQLHGGRPEGADFLLAIAVVGSLTALLRRTSVVLLLRLLLASGIVDTSGKFTVHVCRTREIVV
jgi:hypothetical protein